MSEEIVEVSESTFESQVLERSKEVPVVVDFWAPWCGPCRTLGPLLEELATKAAGKWILAKVNVDENPELARAFHVQGIPSVKAFVEGRMADEFTGALPRTAIEAFLDRIAPSQVSQLVSQAAEAHREGDRTAEKALWDQVLEKEPEHDLARIRRARLLLLEGEIEAAFEDLAAVPDSSELSADAANLRQLGLWASRVRQKGGPEAIRERAGENPDDVEARFDFGCALAVAGKFEEAHEEFLEVVRVDRGFEEDAARKAMLALFSLLGDDHELTHEYRKRLSAILF